MSLGIVCSGQGTQAAGMLDSLKAHAEARTVIAEAGALLDLDLWDLCGHDHPDLFANTVAQPVLCATQLAIWAVLRPLVPAPRVFAGYSIGELSAAGCAGALMPSQVVRLARQRAWAMDGACPDATAMAAVRGLNSADLERLCAAHGVWVGIDNGPDRKVIGGRVADLDTFCRAVEGDRASVTRLPVRIASHTPLMIPAIAPFRAALAEVAPCAPAIPVLAGIDGAPRHTAAQLIDALAAQIAQTLRWDECMTSLSEMGCRVILELGPGDSLARMLRDRFPDQDIRSVSEFRSPQAAAHWAKACLSTG